MISGIVYYYIGDITIEGIVTDDNISIIDSYRVVDDRDKLDIIEDLLRSFPWFDETRSSKDMLNEWRVHNFCYSINFKRKRTISVDFELRQNKILKFLYWLVSKFIKKNV